MLLELENVTKRFGDRASRAALDGVSFAVGEREIVGLGGPNGAGKTTAMRLLDGVHRRRRGLRARARARRRAATPPRRGGLDAGAAQLPSRLASKGRPAVSGSHLPVVGRRARGRAHDATRSRSCAASGPTVARPDRAPRPGARAGASPEAPAARRSLPGPRSGGTAHPPRRAAGRRGRSGLRHPPLHAPPGRSRARARSSGPARRGARSCSTSASTGCDRAKPPARSASRTSSSRRPAPMAAADHEGTNMSALPFLRYELRRHLATLLLGLLSLAVLPITHRLINDRSGYGADGWNVWGVVLALYVVMPLLVLAMAASGWSRERSLHTLEWLYARPLSSGRLFVARAERDRGAGAGVVRDRGRDPRRERRGRRAGAHHVSWASRSGDAVRGAARARARRRVAGVGARVVRRERVPILGAAGDHRLARGARGGPSRRPLRDPGRRVARRSLLLPRSRQRGAAVRVGRGHADRGLDRDRSCARVQARPATRTAGRRRDRCPGIDRVPGRPVRAAPQWRRDAASTVAGRRTQPDLRARSRLGLATRARETLLFTHPILRDGSRTQVLSEEFVVRPGPLDARAVAESRAAASPSRSATSTISGCWSSTMATATAIELVPAGRPPPSDGHRPAIDSPGSIDRGGARKDLATRRSGPRPTA